MTIILDSNVILAAFAARGLCASVFELCLDRYTILLSRHIFSEVSRVLQKKIKLPEERIALIINFLIMRAPPFRHSLGNLSLGKCEVAGGQPPVTFIG